MDKKDEISEIKQKMESIHTEYGIDQRELGKIMVIASTALLVVSIHAALTFQSASDSLESSNNDLQRAYGVIDSSSFQNMLDSLESIRSTAVRNEVETARQAFEQATGAMEETRETERMLQDRYDTYQWLTLISLMGVVAGVAVIYL